MTVNRDNQEPSDSEKFDEIMQNLAIPDDLSSLDSLDGDAPREASGASITPRAIILTPVWQTEAVLALAVLAGIKGAVIADDSGAVLVLEDLSPGTPEKSAANLSKLLPGARIVLLHRHGTHIAGAQWESGEAQGEVAAGLVMSAVSDKVETIVIGQDEPLKREDAIDTRTMGRFAAIRALRRITRDGKEGPE